MCLPLSLVSRHMNREHKELRRDNRRMRKENHFKAYYLPMVHPMIVHVCPISTSDPRVSAYLMHSEDGKKIMFTDHLLENSGKNKDDWEKKRAIFHII